MKAVRLDRVFLYYLDETGVLMMYLEQVSG